jgi:hypothetical protein
MLNCEEFGKITSKNSYQDGNFLTFNVESGKQYNGRLSKPYFQSHLATNSTDFHESMGGFSRCPNEIF